MTDVPLTLAIVSTVAPVIAGALPVIGGWIRDSGRDRREQARRAAAHRERQEREQRAECVKLLRQVRDFRVLVQNTCDARGAQLVTYAKQVRQSAADITCQADEVGFMIFATETAANSLAAEAHLLAGTIADKLGASLSPDFIRFDRRVARFKAAAQVALGYEAALAEAADESGLAELVSGELQR